MEVSDRAGWGMCGFLCSMFQHQRRKKKITQKNKPNQQLPPKKQTKSKSNAHVHSPAASIEASAGNGILGSIKGPSLTELPDRLRTWETHAVPG